MISADMQRNTRSPSMTADSTCHSDQHSTPLLCRSVSDCWLLVTTPPGGGGWARPPSTAIAIAPLAPREQNGNIALVSHTGNWHRNLRKLALEAARDRVREHREGVARVVEFIASDGKLLELHPCETVRRKWQVVATCCCGEVRWVG